MARSIKEALRAFEGTLDKYDGSVARREAELLNIFDDVVTKLYVDRGALYGQLKTEGGKLTGTADELARVEGFIDQVKRGLRPALINPGREWADAAIPEAFSWGREMARTSMTHNLIDEDLVGQAFAHVLDAEAGVLRVGIQDTYRVMGTIGNDIGEFFRRELTEAMILGLPVQGPGSLTERLFESGRLKALTVKSSSGKIITRSLRQRAVAIARVEMGKVTNRVHEIKTVEVLGKEAVYVNINPEDNRTTDICLRASRSKPKTMAEWDKSPYGRPPRLRPFHLCRSALFGATRDMLKEADHEQARARRETRVDDRKARAKRAAAAGGFIKQGSVSAAEGYAKTNGLVSGQVDYTGMSTETSNEVNRALWDIKNKYGYKPVTSIGAGKGFGSEWASAEAGVKINIHAPLFNHSGFKAEQSARASRYAAVTTKRKSRMAELQKVADSPSIESGWAKKRLQRMESRDSSPRYFSGDDLPGAGGAYGVVMHEYGHVAFANSLPTGKGRLGAWKRMGIDRHGDLTEAAVKSASKISEYATSLPGEYFAEAWGALHAGQAGLLTDDMAALVRQVADGAKAK
tara:strand:+ start:14091 stop:15818 length:1728 start_codon:yes stop_codon:yes gene_type:complete